ncbi:MAG: HAMP domain-containing protein [Gammaproteobacteria bacterium]|nr:MAG: HAMP domain-containing protein [Gammaproteobacteria bacterium]
MEQSRLIPFPSIRVQLLLLALIVFVLPWIGIQSIREMEMLLREQQTQALANVASTVSEAIALHPASLVEHDQAMRTSPLGTEIYVNQMSHHLMMDGFADDWPDNIIWQSFNSQRNRLNGQQDTQLSYDLAAGEYQDTLYLLIRIRDDVLYQTENAVQYPRSGDHLLLTLSAHNEDLRHYVLSSSAPGWLRVIPHSSANMNETRLQAELQGSADGYTVEIAIPGYLAGTRLALSVVDRDNDSASYQSQVGTTLAQSVDDTGLLFSRNNQLKQIIERYLVKNQKISVLDKRSNILAESGDLLLLPEEDINDSHVIQSILNGIFRLILIADTTAGPEQQSSLKMQGEYIRQALEGNQSSQFSVTDQGVGLVSVSIPQPIDGNIVGALVIESTTQGILGLKHRAIYRMITTTLIAIAVVALILVFYATLLAGRIRRLKHQMHNSVAEDGRIKNTIRRSIVNDEIGDLNRGFADMVGRLHEYNRYLETMASKLSHELRTPLTVVQSSLENLQQQSVDANEPLLERANEGLSRLRMILSNLTEASRLENALKTTETEQFNLVNVVEGCVGGYRQAYPNIEFEYLAESDSCQLTGSPELIAQLLDKLVANAIDFHTPDTSIRVSIHKKIKYSELSVENQGPALPEAMQGAVFESMVSKRDKKNDTPHLGLGLFIVRLIAEFHHGKAFAMNTKSGVRFTIRFRSY